MKFRHKKIPCLAAWANYQQRRNYIMNSKQIDINKIIDLDGAFNLIFDAFTVDSQTTKEQNDRLALARKNGYSIVRNELLRNAK